MRWWLLAAVLALDVLPAFASEPAPVRVGSKKFTESVILGEVVRLVVTEAGSPCVHRQELGGTRILWNALLSGEIDLYPEYTGTITGEILAEAGPANWAEAEALMTDAGLQATRALGFNNTYILGMREERAEELGIRKVSDLRAHPSLKLGFSNEFMERDDGWPGLKQRYALPHASVTGLDHDLAYRGIESGDLDVTELYSTDAEIRHYGLRCLVDDLGYFPDYQAVIVYRRDLAERAPLVVAAVRQLEGRIDAARMVALNARAKLDGEPEAVVAAGFVAELLDTGIAVELESRRARIWRHTLEHLALVSVSMAAAILLAIPLGVLAAHRRRLGQLILGLTGVLQTVPSLALLVFMIPLLGIGPEPAVAALFLYSLLPIVRNTHAGLLAIPEPLRESAAALGLPFGARLLRIELPLASPHILAGIKTAVVINIGTATLGALIGAGGYGQPILTGIRRDDVSMILEGAIPAALLALVAQGVFELAERDLVPRGLRV